jgi:hypothetical protein
MNRDGQFGRPVIEPALSFFKRRSALGGSTDGDGEIAEWVTIWYLTVNALYPAKNKIVQAKIVINNSPYPVRRTG